MVCLFRWVEDEVEGEVVCRRSLVVELALDLLLTHLMDPVEDLRLVVNVVPVEEVEEVQRLIARVVVPSLVCQVEEATREVAAMEDPITEDQLAVEKEEEGEEHLSTHQKDLEPLVQQSILKWPSENASGGAARIRSRRDRVRRARMMPRGH